MQERERKPYLVQWNIQLDAADPIEAALEARMSLLKTESTATIFEVIPEYESAETPFLIDLLEIEEARERYDLPSPRLTKAQRDEIADKLALDQTTDADPGYLFDVLRNGFPGYSRMSDDELLDMHDSLMSEPYFPDEE